MVLKCWKPGTSLAKHNLRAVSHLPRNKLREPHLETRVPASLQGEVLLNSWELVELGHVTCFGQWNGNGSDLSHHRAVLKSLWMALLFLPCLLPSCSQCISNKGCSFSTVPGLKIKWGGATETHEWQARNYFSIEPKQPIPNLYTELVPGHPYLIVQAHPSPLNKA